MKKSKKDRPLTGAYLEGDGTVSVLRTPHGLAFSAAEQDANVAMLALLGFYLGGPLVGLLVLLAILLPRRRRGRLPPDGGRAQVVRNARLRVPWEDVERADRAAQTIVVRRQEGEPVVFHVRGFHVARADGWLRDALGDRFAVCSEDELRRLLPTAVVPDSVDPDGPTFVERLLRPRSHAVVTVCLVLAAIAGGFARWGPSSALPIRVAALSCLAAGVLAGWIHRGLRYADERQRERLLRRGVRPAGPVPCGVRQTGHVGAALWPFVRGDAAPHALGLAVVARPRSGPEVVFTIGLALAAGLAGFPYLPMWLCGLAALTALLAIDAPARRAELEVVRTQDVQTIERSRETVSLLRGDGPPVELRPVAERRDDLIALLKHALPDADVESPTSARPPPPGPRAIDQLDESLQRLRSLQDR